MTSAHLSLSLKHPRMKLVVSWRLQVELRDEPCGCFLRLCRGVQTLRNCVTRGPQTSTMQQPLIHLCWQEVRGHVS